MSALTRFKDGLVNLVANLGTNRDKAVHSQYQYVPLTDVEVSNAYSSAWLPRKIIDVPALDSLRSWRGWQAEDDQITKLEAEETRLGMQGKLLDTLTKARLFGGAAVYIGTGESDPFKELKPERIQLGGIRHLNVLPRRLLQAGPINRGVESDGYGKPSFYTLATSASQTKIHPSRLVILQGATRPDPELYGIDDGWGDSVLTSLLSEILRADSTGGNIASLVFEAKIDVLRIPNFMASMSDPTYETDMLRRLQLAGMGKGINGMLVLDKEEDYQQKSANFASLRDILMAFMQLVSGAADIPVTRLLGQSPAGLNATGDNDVRNYYDRIHANQKLVITPAMKVLDECLVRSALGTRPPEVWYQWESLWQSTDKERADIGKVVAETIKTVADTALIPEEVMSKLAQNMLTEAGVAPGLEGEMAEWLKANPDGLEGEFEEKQEEEKASALELQDAAPRPLYVHRKVVNSAELLAWAEAQGFKQTLPADDLHVTIAFSRAPVDWMKLGSADWSGREDGSLTVKPGGARLIDTLNGGAVVLLFNSSDLSWRHRSILDAGASWDYPDYQPHITITYNAEGVDLAKVEPYRGAIHLGPEIFEPLDVDWKAKINEEDL